MSAFLRIIYATQQIKLYQNCGQPIVVIPKAMQNIIFGALKGHDETYRCAKEAVESCHIVRRRVQTDESKRLPLIKQLTADGLAQHRAERYTNKRSMMIETEGLQTQGLRKQQP